MVKVVALNDGFGASVGFGVAVGFGVTVGFGFGAVFTVTLHLNFLVLAFTVITAEPFFTALIFPLEFTRAILGLEDT